MIRPFFGPILVTFSMCLTGTLSKTYFYFLFLHILLNPQAVMYLTPLDDSPSTFPFLKILCAQVSLFKMLPSTVSTWWLGHGHLKLWAYPLPDQLFVSDTCKFTVLDFALLVTVWLIEVLTNSPADIISIKEVLSAAIITTKLWREGWELLIQELDWTLIVREFGAITVTVVTEKPLWGQKGSDLQRGFHSKWGSCSLLSQIISRS